MVLNQRPVGGRSTGIDSTVPEWEMTNTVYSDMVRCFLSDLAVAESL